MKKIETLEDAEIEKDAKGKTMRTPRKSLSFLPFAFNAFSSAANPSYI
jgi:hypothetical protein